MLDNVQRRGVAVANRCYLCGKEEENCNHLLLHCGFSRAVWHLLISLFGVSWVLPHTVKDLLLSSCGLWWVKKSVADGTFIPFLDDLAGKE